MAIAIPNGPLVLDNQARTRQVLRSLLCIVPGSLSIIVKRSACPNRALPQRVDQLLFNGATPLPAGTSLAELAQTLLLLLELFHDFTCQDLPQFFEDNLNVFMGDTDKASAGTATGEEFGLIGKYLRWEKPELLGDVSQFTYSFHHIAENPSCSGRR